MGRAYQLNKKDANHTEVLNALRAAGCKVLDLSQVGHGAPDLLVARRGKVWLLEVKDGRKARSCRKLRAAQVEFFDEWTPHMTVEKVESAEQALLAVGLLDPEDFDVGAD